MIRFCVTARRTVMVSSLNLKQFRHKHRPQRMAPKERNNMRRDRSQNRAPERKHKKSVNSRELDFSIDMSKFIEPEKKSSAANNSKMTAADFRARRRKERSSIRAKVEALMTEHGPAGFPLPKKKRIDRHDLEPDLERLCQYYGTDFYRPYFGGQQYTSTYVEGGAFKKDIWHPEPIPKRGILPDDMTKNAEIFSSSGRQTNVLIFGYSEAGKSILTNALINAEGICPSLNNAMDVTNQPFTVGRKMRPPGQPETTLLLKDSPGFLHQEKLERRAKSKAIGSVAYTSKDVAELSRNMGRVDALLAVVDSTSQPSKRMMLPVAMKEALDEFQVICPNTPISLVFTKYDQKFARDLRFATIMCRNQIAGTTIDTQVDTDLVSKKRSFPHFDHVFLTSAAKNVGIHELRHYLISLGKTSADQPTNVEPKDRLHQFPNDLIYSPNHLLQSHASTALLMHLKAYMADIEEHHAADMENISEESEEIEQHSLHSELLKSTESFLDPRDGKNHGSQNGLGNNSLANPQHTSNKKKRDIMALYSIGLRNIKVGNVRYNSKDSVLTLCLQIDRRDVSFKFRQIERTMLSYLQNTLQQLINVNTVRFEYEYMFHA